MQNWCFKLALISLALFFWLNCFGLCVSSQSATPHLVEYMTILNLLLQLSSCITGRFTFLCILCLILCSVGLSLAQPLSYPIKYLGLSIYLTIYLFKCWSSFFSRHILKYLFWNLWSRFDGSAWCPTLPGYFGTHIPMVCLTMICLSKVYISCRYRFFSVTGGKRRLRRHIAFQFGGKMWKKRKKWE